MVTLVVIPRVWHVRWRQWAARAHASRPERGTGHGRIAVYGINTFELRWISPFFDYEVALGLRFVRLLGSSPCAISVLAAAR